MKKVLKYSEIKELLNGMLQKGMPINELEHFLLEFIEENPSDTLKYKKAFFALIKDIDLKKAVVYGEDIIKQEQDPKFIKVLAVRYKRLGLDKKYDLYINHKVPVAEFKNKIDEIKNKEEDFGIVEKYIKSFIETYPYLENQANKIVFSKLKDLYTKDVLPYGEKVIQKEKDNYGFMKVLANRYKRIGNIQRAEEILSMVM